jgi:hypothetical protein
VYNFREAPEVPSFIESSFTTRVAYDEWTKSQRVAHTRSVYPTTFHIETPDGRVSCGVNSLLPEGMQPREHLHYSQRTFSWDDDALVKTD